MNIFYLDNDIEAAAEMHCDKHVVKMVLEYAQLLCTAHRVCDGVEYTELSKASRKIKRWRLPAADDDVLYKAAHVNHPCSVWSRRSVANYNTLYQLFTSLLSQYTARYGKTHACDTRLRDALKYSPRNILDIAGNLPPNCVPDHLKKPSLVESYRNYYKVDKKYFAVWNKSVAAPSWFTV